MYALVQEHLSQHVGEAPGVLQLLRDGLGRELRCFGEHPPEDGHVQGVLHAAQVEAPKQGERGVASPVDILHLFLLELQLHQQVGGRGLERRKDHAEDEGVVFRVR